MNGIVCFLSLKIEEGMPNLQKHVAKARRADAEAAAQQHLLDIPAHDKNDTLDGLHVETLLGARLRVVEPHCGESIRFLQRH